MKTNYYLFWATGADKPGIVADVAKHLYQLNCNLEDSSMMRLGSEFGILLIFTSKKILTSTRARSLQQSLKKRFGLDTGLKKISKQLAQFHRPKNSFLISLHGADKPGLVYKITSLLAARKFNITDLSTHRTTSGKRPGYILFVEGELASAKSLKALTNDLQKLEKSLAIRVTVQPLTNTAL